MSIALKQYFELTKPRVVALIVFTAIIGMFLAVPGMPPWKPVIFGSLGIWLAASSAAAINHLLDQRIDALMARTSHRPLPSGGLNSRQVLVFALVLGGAVDAAAGLAGQRADRGADLRLADRLRHRLHRLPQARHAAEHRDRRRRRRRAAGAGLGRDHGNTGAIRTRCCCS